MIKRKEIFRLCKDLTHARYELKDLLIGVDEAINILKEKIIKS